MHDNSLDPDRQSDPARQADTAPTVELQPRRRRSVRGSLVLLAVLVVALVFPYLAQRVSYSIALGRLQAEAQVAREVLADGHPVSLADYRWVVRKVEPSVVGVKASHLIQGLPSDELSAMIGEGPQYRAMEQGSGVIVDDKGYIITNYHVVSRATQVDVELADNRTVSGKVVGTDKLSDIAVVKINADGLVAAQWGSSEKIEVGDPVLAIGSPFGLARTVTAGIISAKGRRAVIEHLSYQDFLQTDAAVNPGNSGGPLVNMQGQVVGINTAIVGPTYQGIGFAIPSELAEQVYETLRTSGRVARGWLGVATQAVTPELAQKFGLESATGALVTAVVPDSPAAAAGIEPGDVIVRWNDHAVNDFRDLGPTVAATKPESKATLILIRNGKKESLSIQVGERPAQGG